MGAGRGVTILYLCSMVSVHPVPPFRSHSKTQTGQLLSGLQKFDKKFCRSLHFGEKRYLPHRREMLIFNTQRKCATYPLRISEEAKAPRVAGRKSH